MVFHVYIRASNPWPLSVAKCLLEDKLRTQFFRCSSMRLPPLIFTQSWTPAGFVTTSVSSESSESMIISRASRALQWVTSSKIMAHTCSGSRAPASTSWELKQVGAAPVLLKHSSTSFIFLHGPKALCNSYSNAHFIVSAARCPGRMQNQLYNDFAVCSEWKTSQKNLKIKKCYRVISIFF